MVDHRNILTVAHYNVFIPVRQCHGEDPRRCTMLDNNTENDTLSYDMYSDSQVTQLDSTTEIVCI